MGFKWHMVATLVEEIQNSDVFGVYAGVAGVSHNPLFCMNKCVGQHNQNILLSVSYSRAGCILACYHLCV